MSNNTFRQIAITPGRLVLGLVLVHLVTGCATPWEKSALLKDNTPSIDRVQGPTERSLRNLFKKKQEEDDAIAGKSLKPIAGTAEYVDATELYNQEKYEEARKAFRKIHKNKHYKKSEIREDALFMEAECAWKQDYYATAHDAYAVLLKDFPSTRHLIVVSERLFKIGRLWLDFPEVAKLGEIQQVNFDEPRKPLPSDESPKMPKKSLIFKPNFTNKKEPLFDTPGNGVASLTAVWMNDPTGPLAADAMMLVASYYARRGNYVEADRHFQNLRELYPNSRHVQNAFVLGSHVKLMSYQGPDYETRSLQEAQLLKESVLRIYEDYPDPGRLRDELAKIEEAKAEVIWHQALLYQRKGKKRSSAIYCHDLITQFPKSTYAEKARAKLVELGPEYETGAVFLSPKDPDNRRLIDKILEPPTPEWMKDPRVLVSTRKKAPKADNKAKSDAKAKKTDDRSNAADDPDMLEKDNEPAKGRQKSSVKPRRLVPFGSDKKRDSEPEDDDKEKTPTDSGSVNQASSKSRGGN